MKNLIYLFFGLIFLPGCNPSADESSQKLGYEIVRTEFKSPDCEPETDACLMITIDYPHFDKGDSIARHLANRIVKNSILDNIGMGDAEATEDPSIEMVIEDLNGNFEDVKSEFGDYGTGWQANIGTKELYQSDSIMVLSIGAMTYFGGAHPNYNLRYFNFDRNTGRYLPISTFVKDLGEFTSRAEIVFKKTYNIEEGTSYSDAGFTFLGDYFILSANYAFLGDSVKLHYNHYEISSYAAGDFEITVALK
jgi:hypothetical protein